MDANNTNGRDSSISGIPFSSNVDQEDNRHILTLSLSSLPNYPNPSLPPPPAIRSSAPRRRSSRNSGADKSPEITPPYEWATNRRATIYSLSYLLSKHITSVRGTVQCRRCERQYDIVFDLQKNFDEVASYFHRHKVEMCHRAPKEWQCPTLPTCRFCEQENSLKPVISPKKRSINWLFLFLGQMLGCCTLEQLKYFCKHTKNHRTGAKNRVLYLTYLNICKQLDPNGPFDL